MTSPEGAGQGSAQPAPFSRLPQGVLISGLGVAAGRALLQVAAVSSAAGAGSWQACVELKQ